MVIFRRLLSVSVHKDLLFTTEKMPQRSTLLVKLVTSLSETYGRAIRTRKYIHTASAFILCSNLNYLKCICNPNS
ncbi:hypothetical protein C0J52_22892 [Blattella germanica]|nr:hypothetical protein C0J52_22892 [Blattella germanica]